MKLHWRRFCGRTVRVHAADRRDGRTVEGVLVHASRELLVLRAASVPQAGAPPIPIEGEVVIERAAIIWGEVR